MSVKTTWLFLVCGLALWVPVVAQDEPAPTEPAPAEPKPAATEAKPPAKTDLADPPLHRWGGWTLSVAGWGPTLIGAEEDIAVHDTGGVLNPILEPVVQRGETRIKVTTRVTYHIPHDKGSIVGQYDSMNNDDNSLYVTPGQFGFLETRAYPISAGVFNDGRADGVGSSAIRRTREFRLEYQNKAFDSKWARGNWAVGLRSLSHERALGISYYALVPNLPPLIPPVADHEDQVRLTPFPDTAGQSSDFNGHGLGASFDVVFPLHPRVSIVTGLSVGVVKGTIRSSYVSNTSFYYLGSPDHPMTTDELFAFLMSPPPATTPPDPPAPTIGDIQQQLVTVALNTSNTSQMATSFDVYVGVQVNIWKGLKAFVLARDVAHNNVGTYVVPKPGPSSETTSLNDGYEGYALGLSWRF